ncbi:protein SPO16 homolog [Lytechinus variegatus]|uniref:protein SPO16 homolog n=1 Tax=Lytechinus variegatus TaxID=7654 RepID=UPI001BB264F7|nr:protein SPO16 homolog [Lytechinus variegatus]
MAAKGKATSNLPPKWPVVVNGTLKDTDISTLLLQRHKVRFSDTTVSSSIIFPLSSVAFLIVPLEKTSLEWPPKSGRIQLDHEFLQRLQKFVQIHRNSYMVLTSALHGPHEMAIISAIQTRFIDHNLRILPVHNDSECLQTILTIAQATCTPTCNILRSRLDAILSRQNSAQMILNILSQLGLNHHHILTKILKAC